MRYEFEYRGDVYRCKTRAQTVTEYLNRDSGGYEIVEAAPGEFRAYHINRLNGRREEIASLPADTMDEAEAMFIEEIFDRMQRDSEVTFL